MNILSINTSPNNNIAFQANPKIVLTKDIVKAMPVEDILELSSATLKNQDINIVRMIFSKISSFVKYMTSKYSYLKANEMNFPAKELEKAKTGKKKATKIEKALSSKIQEEKIKRGIEINQGTDDRIPIEYLILPDEEKLHQKMIKYGDLLIDFEDASRYKCQRAKHDRKLARNALFQIEKLRKVGLNAEVQHCLDVYTIDYDYLTKKTYNEFAEKILFAETKSELTKLQEKICNTTFGEDWLKSDLLELINRKINLL